MMKRKLLGLATTAFVASTLIAAPAHADDMDPAMAQAIAAIDAAMPGKLINNPFSVQFNVEGGDARGKVVEAQGVPGGAAYNIRVKKKKKNPWDTATRIPMTADIADGETIIVSFWARAVKPPKGSDTGKITVALQRNIDPYDAVVQEDIDLGTEWKLYTVGGTANRSYPANRGSLNFNLAHAKQTVELGTFYISSLGQNADYAKYVDK